MRLGNMKISPTPIFIILIAVVQSIGMATDFPWDGIITWTLTVIFLFLAVYFAKFSLGKRNSK